jgi:hypothetical protein
MMMRRRRTTGARPVGSLVFPVLAGLLIPVIWSAGGAVRAADKKPKKAAEAYALVAGTVFQNSGLSLPGAEVTVTAIPQETQGGKLRKSKPLKYVSDARGEFAVRLPAVPMRYTVSVKSAGFEEQEKQVTISGDERVDLFFRLGPVSK